jgi:Family of unknown function (DUF6062)
MSEKVAGDFKLVQACGQPGCPVCRCVGEESRGHLDALIAEHVTDPDTRRALRDAWGFCNWHTWMLLEIEGSPFGASILCEDLVRRALHRLEEPDVPRRRRLRAWLRPSSERRRPAAVDRYARRSVCTVCVSVAETERHHLLTLVRSVRDGALEEAYGASDGICLPHLLRAVELTAGTSEARPLVERTRHKWAAVQRDLESFIEKHDYRNRAAYTDADAGSYMRAFEILAGAKGAFGNDLTAARRRTGR